jgi:hypothetical protein
MSGFRRSLQTMKRNWCPLGNEYQLYPNNTPDGEAGSVRQTVGINLDQDMERNFLAPGTMGR